MRTNLHYITEEDGRSLSVVNGVVTPSSQPKHLPNAPAGAKDVVISWERIANRYGIQRTFTTPLQYVLDAARIIRHYFYNVGYEHKLFHLIQRQKTYMDDTTFRQRYEYLYRGEIDLSTFKDEGEFVTCNIMEGGLDKVLKAKESTVYEIPFDDDAISVKMDGIPIFSKSSLVSIEQVSITNVTTYNLLWLAIEFLNTEGTIVNGAAFSQTQLNYQSSSPYDDNRNLDNNFFEAAEAIQIKIKFPVITGTLDNGISGELYILNSNGTRTQVHIVESDNPTGTVGFRKVQEFSEKEITVSLVAGEKLYLISQAIDSSLIAGGSSIGWSEFTVNIEYESVFRQTYIKAFKPYDLFRKLVEKITGNADDASSSLLQQQSNLVLTSGDAVRGIEGASIKLSLAQFYEHCNLVHFAGEGIENGKTEIETRSKFYNATNPVHLGNAKDLNISLATDLIGNKLKIGWQQPDVEDVNGKYSFNGSLNFQSVITRVVKELIMQSPFSADPYEIEITRINLEGKTTTDDQVDNKVFCLNVTPLASQYTDSFVAFQQIGDLNTIGAVSASIPLQVGTKFTTSDATNPGPFTVQSLLPLLGQVLIVVEEEVTNVAGAPVTLTIVSGLPYELTRETYDTLQGVPTPEVFNIKELTPKRLALKNGAWLRSIFHPFDNTSLEFTSTDKNKDLLTTLAGLTIQEKASIAISSLGGRLFLPIYFEFETEVPQDLIQLLEENPNRCFSFDWNGDTYKGFNVKVSIAINTEESQSVKLLCAPDVDLLKLVA